jgi:putative transcriptional regulator
MSNSGKSSSLFERLQTGLNEGIQFARGKLDLRTTAAPVRPPTMHAREVALLRRQLNMSQQVLAGMLNVSPKTVQAWEHGERTPSQAALRLLQILRARPEVVCEAAGIAGPLAERAIKR